MVMNTVANVKFPHPWKNLWWLAVPGCCGWRCGGFLFLRAWSGMVSLRAFLRLRRDVCFVRFCKVCVVTAEITAVGGECTVAPGRGLIRGARGAFQTETVAVGAGKGVWRSKRAARLTIPGVRARVLESAAVIPNRTEVGIVVRAIYTKVDPIVGVTKRAGMHARRVPVRAVHCAVSPII